MWYNCRGQSSWACILVRAGVTQWGPVSDCVGEVVVRVTLVTDHLDSHSSHTHYCNPGFPSHCGSATYIFNGLEWLCKCVLWQVVVKSQTVL